MTSFSTPQKKPKKRSSSVESTLISSLDATPNLLKGDDFELATAGSSEFDSRADELLRTPVKLKRKRSRPSKTIGEISPQKRFKKLEELNDAESRESSLEEIRKLYHHIHAKTGALGGGGSGGEIYGELTKGSFQKILDVLVKKCGLGHNSVFLDIGAGLGKPNLHAALYPGVKLSLGLEIQGDRWWQSIGLLRSSLSNGFSTEMNYKLGRVFFAHANVLDMLSFCPVTHVYAFNRGMPSKIMEHIAKVFHRSDTSKYFICFDNLKRLERYGFSLNLIDSSVSGSMHGSGEGHKCYIYEKKDVRPSKTGTILAAPALLNERNLRNWIRVPIPVDPKYAACVPQTESYFEGLTEMFKGIETYKEWLKEQLGLTRCSRRLRSSVKEL